MRGRFGSSVYICRIFVLFFSFQVIQRLRYDFPGLLFAEIFELIVKNLSTLDGLYDNSLLMEAPPHMAILPG